MNVQLTQGEGFDVRRVDPSIYVMGVTGNLSRAMMGSTLTAIWSVPDWAQPWGLVVTLDPKSTYDADILRHDIPPDHKRAVGAAIVTANVFHRMMVNSVGIGLRLARFQLSAHASEDEAIERMAQSILEAEARHRPF